ncbi:helix-turn-helix domain-containing protein [Roseovarius nubinhibens]|uniref:helix-turn-helix domain-containing protein n=2 Tax=Roseovarius TaxID=74030 RepID=UPI001C082B40|nr:helix-turn-helix transcriptional regulator [Roseovarius nubinhibens]|tara:strand:- start:298 stop:726 length:429 start_codon:yes stop_codon:yes gene_type:complete
MTPHASVIYHTLQRETSHSQYLPSCGKFLNMDDQASATFIRNVLAAVDADPDLNDAKLSIKAGVNRRMVTDMREGRVKSPKLSSVFAIAKALNRDPGELMGLGPRPKIRSDLSAFLSQYDEDAQARILHAMKAFPPAPSEER